MFLTSMLVHHGQFVDLKRRKYWRFQTATKIAEFSVLRAARMTIPIDKHAVTVSHSQTDAHTHTHTHTHVLPACPENNQNTGEVRCATPRMARYGLDEATEISPLPPNSTRTSRCVAFMRSSYFRISALSSSFRASSFLCTSPLRMRCASSGCSANQRSARTSAQR